MKKTLSIVLALILTVGILAGCGGGSTTSSAPAEPAAATDAGSEGEGAGDALSSIKVGFITLHDENSTYDLNFINSAKEACAQLGIPEENYLIRTNIPEGQECYDAAADLVDAGCTTTRLLPSTRDATWQALPQA